MPHDSLSPDASFLNEEFDLRFHPFGLPNRCGEEQPTHTQIADARYILNITAAPANPYTLRRLNS